MLHRSGIKNRSFLEQVAKLLKFVGFNYVGF